jgi:hypothetical protein
MWAPSPRLLTTHLLRQAQAGGPAGGAGLFSKFKGMAGMGNKALKVRPLPLSRFSAVVELTNQSAGYF